MKQQRFWLVCLMVSSIVVCTCALPALSAENTLSYDWMKAWKKLASYPAMNPQFREADFILDSHPVVEDDIFFTEVYLTSVTKRIGAITVDADNSISSFRLDKMSDGELFGFEDVSTISFENAQKMVNKFLDYYIPTQRGERTIIADNGNFINKDGIYKFKIYYYYRKINIRYLDIQIDYQGTIVGFYDGNTEINTDKYVNQISEPPSEAQIKEKMEKYLLTQPIVGEYRLYMGGRGAGINEKGILEYSWVAQVKSHAGRAGLYYNERTGKFKLEAFNEEGKDDDINIPDPPAGSYRDMGFPITDECPIWTLDGKSLWFATNRHWKHVPEWYPTPDSLAHFEFDKNNLAIYRPLVDHLWSGSSYAYPSFSPDGRWLACTMARDIVAIIDLKNNNLYYVPDIRAREARVSWNKTSRQIAFADARGHAVLVNVEGESGVQFSDAPTILKMEGITAFEFLPNATGKLIAIQRTMENRNAKTGGELISIALDENDNASVEEICKLDSPAWRMHVTPAGDAAILATEKGIFTVNLVDKSMQPMPGFSAYATPAPNTQLIPNYFDWDISPDGTKMVFTLERKDDRSRKLYLRDMKSGEISPLTISTEPAERYVLDGKYPVVNKNSIPLTLFERIYQVPVTKWLPAKK